MPGDTTHCDLNPPERHRSVEQLLDNLPGMVYRCANDRPWTLSFVSAGFEAITGHRRALVFDGEFGWTDLVHAEDRQGARAAVNAALKSERPFDIQYRIIDKSGSEKWVREQGCGVYATDGSIEAIEGYIDDITALRNADISLEQAESFHQEQARQRGEWLAAVIEDAHVGIITCRSDGSFQNANDTFCRMTGYSIAELRKKTLLDITHPDNRAASALLDERVRRGVIDAYSQRQRYVHKDGSVIDVSTVNAVTRDAAGRPSLVLIQVLNITDKVRVRSRIRRQQEQLAHADRLNTLGEMATGIAHELNQPLTAISLFAQTGRRLFESGDYDSLSEIFDKLSRHSRRASAIIERMHDMAQSNNQVKQIVDLNVLVEDIMDLADVDARMSDIVIDLDLAPQPLKARADVVQIQQVVLNLLRNGIDAMRSEHCRHGNAIRIRTRKRDDGFLEVAVIDGGHGVSDEVAEQLFESFSTTKNAGLGMGLPISNAIIVSHGGQISFENNQTRGATFTFTLPAVVDGAANG